MASALDLISARTTVRNAVLKAIMDENWKDIHAAWDVVDAAATNLAKVRIAYDIAVRKAREAKWQPDV